VYAYSNQPEHKFRVASDKALALGDHVVRVKFEYEGGGIDKAATATLMTNLLKAARRISRGLLRSRIARRSAETTSARPAR
jgi:hypothetical protein